MAFPSKEKSDKMRKKLEKVEGSLALPPNASAIEKLRYDICKQFVIYKREKSLTSRELAKKKGGEMKLLSLRFYTTEQIDFLQIN